MNWRAWFLAMLFSTEQTYYFGFRWLPQTDAELFADGIVILLFAISTLKQGES